MQMDYELDWNVALADPLYNPDKWEDKDKVRVWWTPDQIRKWHYMLDPIPSSDKAEALAKDGVKE